MISTGLGYSHEELCKMVESAPFIKKLVEEQRPVCLHAACTRCHGTGVDKNGKMCVHALSCPCPKCSWSS